MTVTGLFWLFSSVLAFYLLTFVSEHSCRVFLRYYRAWASGITQNNAEIFILCDLRDCSTAFDRMKFGWILHMRASQRNGKGFVGTFDESFGGQAYNINNKLQSIQMQLEHEESTVEYVWQEGNIVWAKITGHPWWPAMVT